MNSCRCLFLLALLLVGLAFHPFRTSASPVVSRRVTKTFSVAEGGTLVVESGGGRIDVRTSAESTVTVRADERIDAASPTEAEAVLKGMNLRFGRDGSTVFARAAFQGTKPLFFSGSWPPVRVDFAITVPRGFSVRLHSGGGRVAVGDLRGSVQAETGGGEITLGQIGGGVEMTTGGGSVRLDSVGEQLHASTGGGSLEAAITGSLHRDSEVETSGGSVRLSIDRKSAFTLDAASDTESVEIDGFPIDVGDASRAANRFAGRINGGGALLKLRSGGGSLEIAAR